MLIVQGRVIALSLFVCLSLCTYVCVHYYYMLHLFNGLFFRTSWVSQHQKGKPFWILLEQEMMGW